MLTDIPRKIEDIAPAAFRIQQNLKRIVAEHIKEGGTVPEVFWRPDDGSLFWYGDWYPPLLVKVSRVVHSPDEVDLDRLLVPIPLFDSNPVPRYIAWTGLRKGAGFFRTPIGMAMIGAAVGSLIKGLEYKTVSHLYGYDIPFRRTAPTGAVVGSLIAGVPSWFWNMYRGLDPLTALVTPAKGEEKKKKPKGRTKKAFISNPLNLAELRSPIPSIHVDRLNMRIMSDPNLTDEEKAKVMGIASGAMTMRRIEQGGRLKHPVVSTRDVARIAMAMGSGYLKGKLLGKALEFVAGVPAPVSSMLASAGMTTGMIRGIINEVL